MSPYHVNFGYFVREQGFSQLFPSARPSTVWKADELSYATPRCVLFIDIQGVYAVDGAAVW